MAENQNKPIKFWQELKRRKLVGVIIVYATTAFILIQLAPLLEGSLHLPPWFDTLITLLLIIGFPIAVIFSWVFDVSSKGIQKTDSLEQESLPDKKSLSILKYDPPEKSIIVLPFDNMSPEPDQEYFSDGLTEEIITDLSHVYDLLVISRSSAMTFKGSKQTLKKIAQKVNVKYVLEGSVRKSENNLRIVAQLIDARNDTHIWAEKYSGTLDAIFDIQEKVSQSIVEALKIKLTTQENKQIAERLTKSVDAYECYLKAKYEISRASPNSFARALKIIETGLELYSEDALLYATLGYLKYFYFDAGFVNDESFLDEAEKYAKKSLSLDARLAQGFLLLALLERGRGDLMKGYHYIKKAIEINPEDTLILIYTIGFLGIYAGQISKSKVYFKKLIEKYPLSPINYLFFGFGYYFIGEFETGMNIIQKSFHLDPEFPWGTYWYAIFHAMLYMNNESIQKLEQATELKNLPDIHVNLLHFYKFALRGEKEKALDTLTGETKKYLWNDPDLSGIMPGWYAFIDQKEESLKFLEHAINRGWINYPFFAKHDPLLENIRGEERFKKLMERVKKEWGNFEV